MSDATVTRPAAGAVRRFSTLAAAARLDVNPWGRPRFLVLITWAYMVWSIVPVLIAIQFSFNDSRSLSVWHGFSTSWYWGDPVDSVLAQRPDLRAARSTEPEAGRRRRASSRRRWACCWRWAWPAGAAAARGRPTS